MSAMPEQQSQRQWQLDLAESALLVIDMQQGFAYKEVDEITDNVISLVKQYKARKLPVFFSQHGHYPSDRGWLVQRDGLPGEGSILIFSDNFALLPAIDAVAGRYERIIKSQYSAFEDTDLVKRLSYTGAKSVVIVGTMTNYCVEDTARTAVAKNLKVVIVKDAVASYQTRQAENSLYNLQSYGAILSCADVASGLKAMQTA